MLASHMAAQGGGGAHSGEWRPVSSRGPESNPGHHASRGERAMSSGHSEEWRRTQTKTFVEAVGPPARSPPDSSTSTKYSPRPPLVDLQTENVSKPELKGEMPPSFRPDVRQSDIVAVCFANAYCYSTALPHMWWSADVFNIVQMHAMTMGGGVGEKAYRSLKAVTKILMSVCHCVVRINATRGIDHVHRLVNA